MALVCGRDPGKNASSIRAAHERQCPAVPVKPRDMVWNPHAHAALLR
jgi:hypothetical protein